MIGIIGDLHFRQDLAYADYVADRREGERKQILDFIVEQFSDCDQIVFLGDQFHIKHNPNQVVRAFTEFVERFSGKEIFMISGNHDKLANGQTAIDYLREIKNPQWHIITNKVEKFGDMVFCPYFYKNELGSQTNEEGTAKLLDMLPEGKILFTHHAISDTLTDGGTNTNLFQEIVFPKTTLEQRYSWIVGGHIHKPGRYGKTIVAGSIFTAEVGELEKFIWKINENEIEQIPLPVRPIEKLENPEIETLGNLALLSPHRIIKVIFDRIKPNLQAMDTYREILKKFDAYTLIEQYPHERRQVSWSEGEALDFSITNLLHLYAKERKVDESKLMAGWELIK